MASDTEQELNEVTEKTEEEQQKVTAEDSETSSDSDSSEDESAIDITERGNLPAHLQPQVERLKALRARLAHSSQENKKQVYEEYQRSRENPGAERRTERKRRAAEIAKDKMEYQGDDYERTRFKEYSVEQVERYEEKRRKNEDRRETGFTDFAQVNRRKYERDVAKLKPDLAAYEREKAGEGSGGQHRPDPRNVEKLVKLVDDQQKRRDALHRPEIEKEGEDVTYINDKNARLHRRINRAYDKYTKEIRDNFERGTAL
ncbi:pre-mRNA-splicing factor SYF2 [Linderina macrospora]|uniref:Pre-mRNA-splicing factor SYF2 n=1 Tax=Linderina macrospora TaxID=4868 RepID=A0ACC1J7E7_9FUNG|nr:pre-mRNA-splicing factor SYF2 [Linderina macrospora]